MHLYRSLGVHISFVRSIAMDSWTDKQLQSMKLGGNQACNDYLQQKTNSKISARTPIRQKYDNPTAQLYKEILKARVEGRPEPTSLPLAVPKSSPPSLNNGTAMNSISHSSMGSQDPNGMERLLGETDSQYVARQTRLREEAKARMAAKFGSGGLAASGSRMQGIGSDARYNPNAGGYAAGNSGGDFDVNSLVAGFGSVLGSAVSTAKSLADEQTMQSIKSTGASFWGGLTSTVSNVAASMTNPTEESDGLADLQRQIAAQKSSQTGSKYSGFGSDSMFRNTSGGATEPSRTVASASTYNTGGAVQEAPGLPGEDRNGVERLTGESDEQYVMRQTRLRDEARARMAAKFGGSGLSGNSSSTAAPLSSFTPPPTHNGNQFSAASSTAPMTSHSAPSSGNFPRNKTPPKMMNSNDFFSSFGN